MAENGNQGIGASVTRKEDFRFLTGRGNYMDDFKRGDDSSAHFVRSPHAHANIKSVDTKARPGVARCGGDPDGRGSGRRRNRQSYLRLECRLEGRLRHESAGASRACEGIGSAMLATPWPLSSPRPRSRPATAPRRLLSITTCSRPKSTSPVRAKMAPSRFMTMCPNNTCYDWEIGDKEATDAAIAGAHYVAKTRPRQQPHRAERNRAALGDRRIRSGHRELYALLHHSESPRRTARSFGIRGHRA